MVGLIYPELRDKILVLKDELLRRTYVQERNQRIRHIDIHKDY